MAEQLTPRRRASSSAVMSSPVDTTQPLPGALDVRGWQLEGGPYDGCVVKAGENEPPILGVSIFPDRLVVQGERTADGRGGEVTYALATAAPGEARRAVYAEGV